MNPSAGSYPAVSYFWKAGAKTRRPFFRVEGKLETHLSRPVPLGGPAGPGRPCNGFAVLHAVAAVPVHGRTIGP